MMTFLLLNSVLKPKTLHWIYVECIQFSASDAKCLISSKHSRYCRYWLTGVIPSSCVSSSVFSVGEYFQLVPGLWERECAESQHDVWAQPDQRRPGGLLPRPQRPVLSWRAGHKGHRHPARQHPRWEVFGSFTSVKVLIPRGENTPLSKSPAFKTLLKEKYVSIMRKRLLFLVH